MLPPVCRWTTPPTSICGLRISPESVEKSMSDGAVRPPKSPNFAIPAHRSLARVVREEQPQLPVVTGFPAIPGCLFHSSVGCLRDVQCRSRRNGSLDFGCFRRLRGCSPNFTPRTRPIDCFETQFTVLADDLMSASFLSFPGSCLATSEAQPCHASHSEKPLLTPVMLSARIFLSDQRKRFRAVARIGLRAVPSRIFLNDRW